MKTKKFTGYVAVCCVAMGMCFVGCQSDVSNEAVRADAKVITTSDDLPGATIGVQLGTTGDIYASDYESEGAKIDRYSKGGDAILALKSGKLDCVIIDNEPAKAFIAANEGLKILDEAFTEEEYAICIAKDNTDLLDQINTALQELQDEGVVKNIIDNFIGDDTKGLTPYESPSDIDRSNGTLVMATNAAFEPYEFIEDNKVVGIDAQLAKAVCDKLGYELEIKDMEFDSIITAVDTGKADFGMAGMTITDERLESINFTNPYTTATQVIIVKE